LRRRFIALMLIMALFLPALPVRGNAAGNKAQKIKDQIVSVYYRSLRRMGKASFAGFCGSAVNNQLYFLGIDLKARGCNGKDEFDQYRYLGTTTGGYPCRAFPASRYTLETVLNAISHNGTRDVYNVLVGFQSTTSEAGQKYGHAVLIQAILDGTVYFAECCAAMVDGKYWPECTAITCSIEAFCAHYAAWTTFDGVIWFGNKGYSEECANYDASLDAMALKTVPLLSEIPNPDADTLPPQVGTVYAGQILEITGILETPEGDLWYEAESGSEFGYVEASVMKTLKLSLEDVPVGWDNVHMPSHIRKGSGFVLGGEIFAGSGSIRDIEISVYEKTAGETDAPLYTAKSQVNGKTVSLSQVTNNVILWRKLPLGDYRVTIRVVVEGFAVEKGAIVTVSEETELWNSEFRVVSGNTWLPEVSFDACGGDTAVERTVTEKKGALGSLPQAEREGYVFLGWYTQPEGGARITERTVIDQNRIVYAHWEPGDPEYTGWLEIDGQWVYYRKGSPVSGWFRYNGLRFWQDNKGRNPNGWRLIRGTEYYFNGVGAVTTGWLETEKGTYYLLSDGRPATGQITIAGREWLFAPSGILVLH